MLAVFAPPHPQPNPHAFEIRHDRPVKVIHDADALPEFRHSYDDEMDDPLARNTRQHHVDYWENRIVHAALRTADNYGPNTIDLYGKTFAQDERAEPTKWRKVADQFISARMVNHPSGSGAFRERTRALNRLAQLSMATRRRRAALHDYTTNVNEGRVQPLDSVAPGHIDGAGDSWKAGKTYSEDSRRITNSPTTQSNLSDLHKYLNYMTRLPYVGPVVTPFVHGTVADFVSSNIAEKAKEPAQIRELAHDLPDVLHDAWDAGAPDTKEGETLRKNIGDEAYRDFRDASGATNEAAEVFARRLNRLRRYQSNPEKAFDQVPGLERASAHLAFTRWHEIKIILRIRAARLNKEAPEGDNPTRARLFQGGPLDLPDVPDRRLQLHVPGAPQGSQGAFPGAHMLPQNYQAMYFPLTPEMMQGLQGVPLQSHQAALPAHMMGGLPFGAGRGQQHRLEGSPVPQSAGVNPRFVDVTNARPQVPEMRDNPLGPQQGQAAHYARAEGSGSAPQAWAPLNQQRPMAAPAEDFEEDLGQVTDSDIESGSDVESSPRRGGSPRTTSQAPSRPPNDAELLARRQQRQAMYQRNLTEDTQGPSARDKRRSDN